MVNLRDRNEALEPPEPLALEQKPWSVQAFLRSITLKKLRGGLLFGVGWLLSPLCWWNDLIFNLPVAYGFGYLCGLVSHDWLMPGTIVGYWLSNIIGILLMQVGAVDVFQAQKQDRNRKKELLVGVLASTVFTLAIVALAQFKLFDLSLPFAALSLPFVTDGWHPGSWLFMTASGR